MSSSNSDVKVSLSTFPANRIDALALLYLQSQNLSDKTPEEVAHMYDDVWGKIADEFKSIRVQKNDEHKKSRDFRMF